MSELLLFLGFFNLFCFLIFCLFTCFSKDPNCARPFEGLKIVDVGCGGGILSEVKLFF